MQASISTGRAPRPSGIHLRARIPAFGRVLGRVLGCGLAGTLVTLLGVPSAGAQFCINGPGLGGMPGGAAGPTVCDNNGVGGVPFGPNGDFNAPTGTIGFFFAGGGFQSSGSAVSPVGVPMALGMPLLAFTGPPTPVPTPAFFTPPGGTGGAMWMAGSCAAGTLRASNTTFTGGPPGPVTLVRTLFGAVYFPTAEGQVQIDLTTFGPLAGNVTTTVVNPGVAGAVVPFIAATATTGLLGPQPAVVADLTAHILDGPATVLFPASAHVHLAGPGGGGGAGGGAGLGEICTVTVLGEDKCYTYRGSTAIPVGNGWLYLKFLENTGDVVIGPDALIPNSPDNHVDHWEAEHGTHAGTHDETLCQQGGANLLDNGYATAVGCDSGVHVDPKGGVQRAPGGIPFHNYFWYGLGDGPAAGGGWAVGQTIVLGFFDAHGPALTPWGGAVVGSTGTGFFDAPSAQTVNPAIVPEPTTSALLATGLVLVLALGRRRGGLAP